MKEFNYEQELAELKEEVQDLLDEIEELEDEYQNHEKQKKDISNGFEQMSMLISEAEKVGMSKYDVMTMLALFAQRQ